jgi:hypothetical protein
MKPAARIAVVAIAMLAASAGALYPLQGSLREKSTEVKLLEADLGRDSSVHEQLMSAHATRRDVELRMSERAFRLCPNTPEAEHEVESNLLQRVEGSGLKSSRMDRRNESLDGGNPCLVIELVVEGDGSSLNRFLRSLEEMNWVTRVLSMSIDAGTSVRRIDIQVAVMLERSP